jgi:glutathione S-transferase
MAVKFYLGSGSPYSWRVFLALEHKRVPYELVTLSFAQGEHKRPEYLAINPRHKVPAIQDGEFSLYESAAIIEYLQERFPEGPLLLPRDVRERATARRLIREIDGYLGEYTEELVTQIFFLSDPKDWDLAVIEIAKKGVLAEAEYFERTLKGDFFMGALSAVDFSLYPLLKLPYRFERRKPDLGITSELGPKLSAWMKRIEALPYYEKTYPPHWR